MRFCYWGRGWKFSLIWNLLRKIIFESQILDNSWIFCTQKFPNYSVHARLRYFGYYGRPYEIFFCLKINFPGYYWINFKNKIPKILSLFLTTSNHLTQLFTKKLHYSIKPTIKKTKEDQKRFFSSCIINSMRTN